MAKRNNFGDRAGRQASEGYAEVETKLPPDRFQASKQVLTPDELGGANAPAAGNTSGATTATKAAVSLKSRMKVAPDASVEMLEGKQVGGVPLEGGLATRSVAGFSGQSTADDTSKVPYQGGNYRPDTRYGKKRSEDLFELDNTVSEQVVPQVEDALDLREAPEAKQGYNGRKQFKQTRSKKNYPGDARALLYDASADIEYHSSVIATSGQVVGDVDAQADYPTRAYQTAPDGTGAQTVVNPMKKGNYLLTGMSITIDAGEKRVKGFHFHETQLNSNPDPVTRDESNLNWQVDGNRVAKAMIRMQTELGRETTDKWSPLGYVIDQPYQYNMLMHDIEATTGAMMAIAYRSAVSSLSYQRNIVNKDGIAPQAAAVRMFLEDYAGMLSNSNNVTSNDFRAMVWNGDSYRRGSAAALIEMFDSINKYRTKADILGMQRSLPLHLSQADNNINPFHLKPEFMKVLDKAHMFSTVSGTYNPMLPIHVTKNIKLINPLSLNFFVQNWKHPKYDTAEIAADFRYDRETGTCALYGYGYTDIRNRYTTRVQHPIVDGLISWILKHEGAFVRTFLKDLSPDESGDVTVYIPAHFDFTNPGLFAFMLCSASQQIAMQRNIAFRDVLFAGEQMTYIWDDLTAIKDVDPLHSTQLTIAGYNEPLKMGKLAADSALRIMWGDHMPLLTQTGQAAGGDTHYAVYAAPWYFNEQAYSNGSGAYTQNEGFKEEGSAFNMSIPSIRDGVRHEYIDLIKSLDERDVRLALDRMTELPVFVSVDPGSYVDHVVTPSRNSTELSAYIKTRALRYDRNSDGRLIVEYNMTDGTNRLFPEAAKYCCAKELGWLWEYPSTMVTPVTSASYTTDRVDGTTCYVMDIERAETDKSFLTGVCPGGSSTMIRSYRVAANAFTDGAIDRSAALTQAYYTAFANREFATVNTEYTNATHIALSLSYNMNGVDNTPCLYYVGGELQALNQGLAGFQSRAMVTWSMLQRVFHPINPFENCYLPSDGDDAFVSDPLENAFYFGVCGTLASDYTQDVLERLDIFDQLNLDYVEDVFIKDSLIFRS